MNSRLLLTTLVFAAAASLAASGWEMLRTETKALENAIDFPSPELGFVSSIGNVVRTVNGGRNWGKIIDRKTFGAPYWFNSVKGFSDREVLVAGFRYGGKGGILARTIDGGLNWNRIELPGATAGISSLTFAADGSVGYVLAQNAGLFRSDDRGNSWHKVKLPGGIVPDRYWLASKRLIAMPSPGTVIVWGGRNTLLRSDDGGKNWKRLAIKAADVSADVCTDLYFSTPQRGWLRLQNRPVTLETADGGATWRVSNAPGMVLIDPDGRTGWAWGEGYQVAETADGGQSWGAPETVFTGKGGIGRMAVAGDYVYAVGGQEGIGVSYLGRKLRPGRTAAERLPDGVVPIAFELKEPGAVSLQILDGRNGEVIEHLGNGVVYPAGKHTVYWNLSTVDDFWAPFEKNNRNQYTPLPNGRRYAPAGEYRWRGVVHPPISLRYRGCYYPLKPAGVPWTTVDRTGGWLGDHEPPHDVLDFGDSMWLGAFAEGGDSLLQCDLDMNKKWGVSRIQLACARLLAKAHGKLYYLDLGGWLGHAGQVLSMIEVNPADKSARRLLTVPKKDPAAAEFSAPPGNMHSNYSEVAGLAVIGDRAYIADRGRNRILVLDLSANLAGKSEAAKIIDRIELEAPGRLRPMADGKLAVASRRGLYCYDPAARRLNRIAPLENGCGLALDREGNFYAGELEPLHQVKVFAPDGRLLRTVGKVGPHRVGTFDPDNLESPTGLAVDAKGQLWVCEHSAEVKRTSVWDAAGRCVKAVYGPTEYGGGGAVDPRNPDRFFYRGNEIVRNADGKYELKNLFWRQDATEFDTFVPLSRAHNFNGPAPTHPFYRDGKLYFRMWGGYGMGELATLFVYDDARRHVRPVAAAGQIQKWMRGKFTIPAADDIFSWTDLNDNGRIEAAELRFGKLGIVDAVWGCRMGENFDVAFSNLKGNVGLAFFEPEYLTEAGYPVYRLPTAYRMVPELRVADPNQVQSVAMDGRGNAIAIAPYLFSMDKSGKVNWRFKCRWPGLHSGLGSTALGNEPGVLIAPIRIWGIESADPALGEIIVVGSNYGVADFFSGNGFYLGRAFLDSRLGQSWRFTSAPTPEALKSVSLGQEHFGGSFQKVNGRYQLIVAGAGTTSVVIELDGLDRITPLAGDKFTVTPAQVAAADRLRQLQQAEAKVPCEYAVTPGRDWSKKQAVDGFKLGYDEKNLYLRYDGTDEFAPFRNAATTATLAEAFTSGDVLDLMIGRDPAADPARRDAVAGDCRLSLVPVGDGVKAVLYDYVVPGTPEAARLRYASPAGSTVIDRIAVLDGTAVTVRRAGNRVTVEAAIPLDALKLRLTPGMRLRGDVGRVVSDQTGTTRIDRVYWSCRNTRIVKDLPSEARLQPNLWGTFLFQ